MTRTEARQIRSMVEQGEMVTDAGGITRDMVQSDKIGYDWKVYTVNGQIVRRDYVPQEEPVGTGDNPFRWNLDLPLIPNGWYQSGEEKKVWTGPYGVTAYWNDERFEVM